MEEGHGPPEEEEEPCSCAPEQREVEEAPGGLLVVEELPDGLPVVVVVAGESDQRPERPHERWQWQKQPAKPR